MKLSFTIDIFDLSGMSAVASPGKIILKIDAELHEHGNCT